MTRFSKNIISLLSNGQKASFLLVLCGLFLFIAPTNGQDWELVKKKNGITVSTKLMEGSELKAYKAEMYVGSSLKTVSNILKDINSYPEWVHNCTAANIIQQKESSILSHFITKVPWPLKDRDNVVQLVFETNKHTLSVKMLNKPKAIPKDSEHIRLDILEGKWEVQTSPNGVFISQVIHADPGGLIPEWLANIAIVETPYRTFANLKKRLQKSN